MDLAFCKIKYDYFCAVAFIAKLLSSEGFKGGVGGAEGVGGIRSGEEGVRCSEEDFGGDVCKKKVKGEGYTGVFNNSKIMF